ncbi:MAG: InlB B-repeat-containing protein [Clostridia bacterium]|nr:InlB B-repeat-containing protein [Clostridia bacterium]
MSKNKFFKKLLVAGICALTATATVGTVVTVAGCKKDEPGSEQTHEYTVKFDLDGGKLNDQTTYSVKVKDGEKVTKPSNPTKTGYKFVKWVDPSDGTEFNFDTVIDSDLTIKAIWEVDSQNPPPVTKVEYTVTINLDGGKLGEETTLTIKVEKDGTLGDALQDVDLTQLKKDGHDFVGWITESGDDYETDTPVTANITIKAKWEAAHQHTWSTEWTKDDDGHYKKATCTDEADCETAKTEEGAHVDADGDLKCDTCDYEATTPTGYNSLLNKEGVDVLVKDTFIVKGKLTDKFNAWGNAGIYYNFGEAGSATTHYVEVSGGKAVIVTPKAKPATTLNVDFGGAYGVIEGYFELSGFVNGSTGYAPVQFIGKDGTKEEVFGLRANTNWNYRLDGGTDVTPSGDAGKIAMEGSKVYFKYDATVGTFTMKINEVDFVTDLQLSGTNLQGIKFSSGDSNDKSFSVDNIIIVNTPVDLEAYKTVINARYAEVNTSVASYSLDLTAAQAAYTAAIGSAATNADCDKAYNDYYAAVLATLKTFVIDTVKTEYPASDYTKTENKADYDKAIADGEAAVNGATTIEKVIKAVEDWGTNLEGIHPDNYYDNAAATVTISDGTNTWTLTGVRVTDEVTKDMLNGVVVVPAKHHIVGYYSDSACTNVLTLPMTLSAENTNVYVKFEETVVNSSEIWKTDVAGTAAGVTTKDYAQGDVITSNTLFELKAATALTYSAGKSYGTISTGSNAASYTNMSGEKVTPDQGIKLTSSVAVNSSSDAFTVTASADITLYLYVVWANDGYNSNKSGTIDYQINAGEVQHTEELTARKSIKCVTVSLKAGEVLKVGGTNKHATDTGKVWLFGAEAKLAE